MTNLKKLLLKIARVIILMRTKFDDFDTNNILIDEKSNENILVHNISYKTLIGSKPLWIKLNKIHGYIGVYDRSRYLVLFGGEKYDFIYNRIRCLIRVKSVLTYVIPNNYLRIKVDRMIFCL